MREAGRDQEAGTIPVPGEVLEIGTIPALGKILEAGATTTPVLGEIPDIGTIRIDFLLVTLVGKIPLLDIQLATILSVDP